MEKLKIYAVDPVCDKAKEILSKEAEFVKSQRDSNIVWTGLTPVHINGKMVACPCTGIDHVKAKRVIHLDYNWKTGSGIYVTSTAEHTLSLILQIAKRKRMQLMDKGIGILGYGRLGRWITKYATTLGMTKFICDPFMVDQDGMYTFDGLLKQSDIISIHVTYNKNTEGMIGKKEFAKMKDGVLIINTSRPHIIKEDDLIAAIECGKVGGYADDFREAHGSGLLDMDNVISTPHIGGNCIEAREMTDIYIAERILKLWRKNPDEFYL